MACLLLPWGTEHWGGCLIKPPPKGMPLPLLLREDSLGCRKPPGGLGLDLAGWLAGLGLALGWQGEGQHPWRKNPGGMN